MSGELIHSHNISSLIRIQSSIRKFLAKRRVSRLANDTWERVFDPPSGLYFWYNRRTGGSQWSKPYGVKTWFSDRDETAALNIQRVARGYLARRVVTQMAAEVYSRYYDAKEKAFYWMDHRTGQTTWEVSRWLMNQKIPLSAEDEDLFAAHRKIQELQEALEKREQELRLVRQRRFEELEPEVLQEKAAAAKSVKRSKHMDDWSTDELAAWFTEMKMSEYVPLLYKNRHALTLAGIVVDSLFRVDGLLFVNLNESERDEMGIHNRFHKRKLAIILNTFQIRYQRKVENVQPAEDDDLSEYTPSGKIKE